MKYLKKYEDISNMPKVGDWVIMTNWWSGKHLQDFISTTPAQITDIKVNKLSTYDYVVKFDKPFLTDADPLNPGKNFRNVFEDGKNFTVGGMHSFLDWVEFYSNNKEDVLAYIKAKKYNI